MSNHNPTQSFILSKNMTKTVLQLLKMKKQSIDKYHKSQNLID